MHNTNEAELRRGLETKYTAARMNLLLVFLFTAVNTVMLIVRGGSYLLFSASVPYYLVDLGMFLCGFYPPEVYAESGYIGVEFLPVGFLAVMIVISVLITLLFLACFILSRKMRGGWLIAALVLFSIDTLAMFYLYGFSTGMMIDILFHAWIIYELVVGILACKKIKALPVQSFSAEELLMTEEEEPHE